MIGPDRIWAWAWENRPSMGQWSSAQEIVGEGNEYIRRDRAVLAALPEVQAIVDAAVALASWSLANVAGNPDMDALLHRLDDAITAIRKRGEDET